MTRPSKRIKLGFVLLAALFLGKQGFAAGPEVRILYPTANVPVFGDIEVEVEIEGLEEGTSVSLLVDGLPFGQRTSPPFRFPVSLGEENLGHRFQVEVVTPSGGRATAAVDTPPIKVDEVVDLALQQVYVTVSSRSGRRVLDLPRDRFRLFDDGRQQQIVTFASGEIPFSALLLIDGSESMRGAQIRAARAGARAFLAGMGSYDRAKVVVFSTRLLAASDFSGPDEPLSHLVEEVRPEGGTSINDFLFLGLQRLELSQGRRVLVLLSDGQDVHSVLGMEQVAGIARQSQTQIFWLKLRERHSQQSVGVNSWRDPASSRRQMRFLGKVIQESGGRIIKVSGPEGIPRAFEEVLKELRDQYALGYYPHARYDDGRWRRLKVEVEGSFRVKAREGYLDLP